MTEVIETLVNPSTIIEVVDVGPVGPPGSSAFMPFSKSGFLDAPYTSPFNLPVPFDSVLDSVILSVGVAPSGSSLILDLLKAGASIYADEGAGRPTILAGEKVGFGTAGSPNPAVFAEGDLIEVEIVQVGSVVPGAHLVMVLSLKRA